MLYVVNIVHCQLSYVAEEAVKEFSVSVYYHGRHQLDSPRPVVGGLNVSAYISHC